MNVMIGIDPGKQTGMSTYHDGILFQLRTVSPSEVAEVLKASGATRAVMEDSRLQSAVFQRPVSRRAMLKIARNVGEVDQICRRIEALCEAAGIELIRVSPQRKGAKLNAARFREITGWTGRSNQHERDAAAVAFPYRRAVEIRGRKC